MMVGIAIDLPEKSSIQEQISLLNAIPEVKTTYEKVASLLANQPLESELVVKQLIAIGQLEIPDVYDGARLLSLIEKLLQIQSFYKEIGGVIGYQRQILELLERSKTEEADSVEYHPPESIDISEETPQVWDAIFAGIEALPQMAAMIPLGGAADRLHLVDESTGSELPAAKLSFGGDPLLAMILRDLQAQEYLHYKLYGKQVTTPLALMTSEEKENHRHILSLMDEYDWFGRPQDSFRFFMQPLVPVVSERGEWCWIGPFKPLMKPGGHGAIWKLARDQGVFNWFKDLGRKKALIRQINNPLAGIDYGFLAFCGIGVRDEMLFGFASCPRLLNAAEGVNVLLERKMKSKSEIVLTNVEYCDFTKMGLENLLQKEGRFSSNTNILFADLDALDKAVDRCPYPGLLINVKKIGYKMETGEEREAPLARLESTMQNIADVFAEEKGENLHTRHTFVTYNHRHKTISTAKKAYVPGNSLQETPEKCFFDLLLANRELLKKHCRWEVPDARSLEEYLSLGPDALFLYHPALGPIYSIIAQKLRRGKIKLGSELQLEIADFDCEGLDLEGSLLIRAEQIMGHRDPILRYSEQTGRCTLKNLKVVNRGVDWTRSTPYWKNRLQRFESVEIILKGHSEFIAEDLVLSGPSRFEVEDGLSIRLFMENGKMVVEKGKVSSEPFWDYSKSERIILK